MPIDQPLLLGSRLRNLRERRGLTQEALATAIGVSRSAVAQWESGRAGQATINLRRLADVLGVAIDQLMGSDQQPADTIVDVADERALLRLYRACSTGDRQLLLLMARRLVAKDQAAEQA